MSLDASERQLLRFALGRLPHAETVPVRGGVGTPKTAAELAEWIDAYGAHVRKILEGQVSEIRTLSRLGSRVRVLRGELARAISAIDDSLEE